MGKRKPRARFWEVTVTPLNGEPRVLSHTKKWWDAKQALAVCRLTAVAPVGSTLSLVRTSLDGIAVTVEYLQVSAEHRWVWVLGSDGPEPQLYPSLGGNA